MFQFLSMQIIYIIEYNVTLVIVLKDIKSNVDFMRVRISPVIRLENERGVADARKFVSVHGIRLYRLKGICNCYT
jgi:hypothetical protein